MTHFLSNLKTEYLPTASNRITFYPGGDTTLTQTSQPRLQVPYLFGYRGQEGNAPHGGINRQWIHDKGDGTYTEYMSSWHWTNPQPDQLDDLHDERPASDADLVDDQHPAGVVHLADESGDAEGEHRDRHRRRAIPHQHRQGDGEVGPAPRQRRSSATGEAIDINPTALSAALAGLGGSAPANYAAARTALIEELNSPTEHPELRAALRTVVGAGASPSPARTR